MARPVCAVCGGKTKGHGKTSSGKRRWQCMSCGATSVVSLDSIVFLLRLFINWLLSKKTQQEMGMSARTFRRKTARFWSIWPVAPMCDEIHHVLYVDGIWLKRTCVILIACTDKHIVGWHLARSENAEAWIALMSRIAPPDVVVTDGGGGFEKARKIAWPNTRVQRCVFHAFNQVKRCTTTRPRTQAGVDLYALSKKLLAVNNLDEAAQWMALFASWCSEYETFLKEKTIVDGRPQYKHERLRKAKRSLEKLVRSQTLFTYLDEQLVEGGIVSAMNNPIEGGVNRQIRAVLNEHRGLRLDRMIKAVFWYCHEHLECPMQSARILTEMPTDETIAAYYQAAATINSRDEAVERWGKAIEWSELHSSAPYRIDYD